MEYEGEFVPGDHTVEEVKEYVDAHPEQKDNIRGSEVVNKNRSTLINYLDHVPEDKAEQGGPAADDVNQWINPGDVDSANPGLAANNDPDKSDKTEGVDLTRERSDPEPAAQMPGDGDPTPGVPPQDPTELKTAQLKSWGVSNEPISWATVRDQPVIAAIRASNLGYGSEASVTEMLKVTYPDLPIQAGDVLTDSTPTDPGAPIDQRVADQRGSYDGLAPRGTGADIPDDDNATNKVAPPTERRRAGLTTADVPGL